MQSTSYQNKLSSLSLVCFVLGSLASANPAHAYLTSRDVEDVACATSTTDAGGDPLNCIDTTALTCSVPNWFPVVGDGGSADSYETYNTFGPDKRWNKTEYAIDQYVHWEHIWYSEVNVPFGPALPDIGHIWYEFAGSTLVKKVTCDIDSTWSWPS